MFENAKWITRDAWERWGYTDDPWENPPAPYIAKTFILKDDVKRASVAVCGLGQAAYYLNGERIPDSLLPTLPFCPTKTVVYTVYDITALVHVGKNRIGALLGNNGYNDIGVPRMRSSLKLICQIDIEYRSGESETIVSDTSWRTHPSPVVGLRHQRCRLGAGAGQRKTGRRDRRSLRRAAAGGRECRSYHRV